MISSIFDKISHFFREDGGDDFVPGRNGINTGGNFITVNVNNYNNGVGGSNPDIGLRMVASSVTAILSLCLLFFLIYRLRRRRLRRCRARAAALAAAAASEANGTSGAEGTGSQQD